VLEEMIHEVDRLGESIEALTGHYERLMAERRQQEAIEMVISLPQHSDKHGSYLWDALNIFRSR
jgi:hypothetical protein